MASEFLGAKPTLQRVLVSQYPILLIDESQDTNRYLMDALLAVEKGHRGHFCLGLFGDTMQRIYSDGKADLESAIPASWAHPAKLMNHRCPKRVVRLINRIRADVDDQIQRARSDSTEGFVRLFLPRAGEQDKFKIEAHAALRMSEVTGDQDWQEQQGFKTLILEHHMAAKRLGFEAFFNPLYAFDRIRTSLLEGSNAGVRFFAKDVLPLVRALQRGDKFAVASIVRSRSPLLEKAAFATSNDQVAQLNKAKSATDHLLDLWSTGREPSIREVLIAVATSKLFIPPEVLQPFSEPDLESVVKNDDNETPDDGESGAWREALDAKFSEVSSYDRYIGGMSPFDTQQGVKGLEFPRVLVVLNDTEARGFLFKYEKLLSGASDSQGDQAAIDRARRLLYVACSRAESSLAIVAYTEDPARTKETAVRRGWFEAEEIEFL